jgi:hypothetical protein
MSRIDSIEETFDLDRALVVGIGGGGDVVGTIPTARLLESHGVSTTVGGLAWERSETDPYPGPRPFRDVTNLQLVSDTVGLVDEETRTDDGIQFAETAVATHTSRNVVLLDTTAGTVGLTNCLTEAVSALDIDLVVGVDAGGDALAYGDEPGLESPLADAISLSALDSLSIPTVIGVYGYGSDGELSLAELESRIARIAQDGGFLGAWSLTPETIAELETLLAHVPTEASRLPVTAAAEGKLGTTTIRNGSRSVSLTPASPLTYYFAPSTVVAKSPLVPLVADTASIDEANTNLQDSGYETEIPAEP